MDIEIYQIIIICISTVMLFQGIKDFLKRETGQTFLKLLVRIIVWGGMAVIAVFPDMTEIFAKIMGFKENVNAVIITAFLLIFLIIFKLLSAIEKIEQNISELTRKDALKNFPDELIDQGDNIHEKK